MRISDWSSDVCSSDLFPAEINLHYCGPDMPGGVGRHASAKIHLLHSVDRQSINAVAASPDKPGDHVVANAAEELVLGPVVGLTQQYHRFGPLHLWFSRLVMPDRTSVV